MIKKLLSFFISLSVGFGLLAWVVYLVGWQEIKSAFLIFTGWQGIVILLLTFIILLTGSWKWQSILKNQGYHLSQRQLFGPYLTGFAMNYLFQMIVVGGDIFRTYVLREKCDVPWKKAITSVIVDKILDATSFVIAILAGLIFFFFKMGLPPKNLAIILGGFLLFFVGGLAFFYFKSFKKQSIAKPLTKFFNRKRLPNGDILEIERETFDYFKFKKPAFWQGLGLAFLRIGLSWARCWVLLLFLGKSVGWLLSLPVLGFYYIAMMIPIPADLGAHEVIQVFAFNSLGLGTSAAPAFAMIQRGAELLASFIGIIFFFKIGMGLFQMFLLRKFDSLIGHKN